MGDAARRAGVAIVGGDTKVVEHGKADGMYITTTGIGEPLPGVSLSASHRSGPAIASWCPARSAITASRSCSRAATSISRPTSVRHALGAAAGRARSSTRPAPACAGCAIRRAAASPPRSTSWRATAASASPLEEDRLPVRDEVRGACELLGLDPLHIANEGQFLAVVAPELAAAALAALRRARRRSAARSSARSARSPGGTVLATPATAAAGSSTCSSAIPCRGSADAPSCLMICRHRRPPTPSRTRLLVAQSRCRARSSRARRRAWRRPASEMAERFLRGGRLLAFGAGRTPPTRSMSRSSSCIR